MSNRGKSQTESTFPFGIYFSGGRNHSEKYLLAHIAYESAHRPDFERFGKDTLRI